MQTESPLFPTVRVSLRHPVLAHLTSLVDDVASAAAELLPRAEAAGPARLRVHEARPLGTVAILALPATRADDYLRHLAAAVLTGNRVLVVPLSEAQEDLARRMAAATPASVAVAGESGTDAPCVDLLVTLGRGEFRLESGPARSEIAGVAGAALLCALYTRRRSHLVRGRSTLRVAHERAGTLVPSV